MPGIMIHLAWQTRTAKGLQGMPSPVDGDPATPWPWRFWLEYLPMLMHHGATVAVTPVLTKGASLGTGYDPYNHYDIGSNSHGPAGRRETRYGSVEGMMEFFARCNALGMEKYVNVCHHHCDGDPGNWKYDYVAGDGKTPGRFPKDINCFWVWSPDAPVNPDAVFDAQWDMGFGREFKWLTGTYGDGLGKNGPGYVKRGLADALDWQTRRLDVDGYFHDDAKGTAPGYIGWLTTQKSMAGKLAFAELSDGNTNTLNYFMDLPSVQRRCGVLDFALRYKIRDVCNFSANMRSILSEGVCWRDPANAITWIEDIDLAISDPIVVRKLLGISMILGFPGYPMLFLWDLLPAPLGCGLMAPVLNLMWCYSTFCKGDHVWRAVESDYLVWERMGDGTSSGVLCCASIRNEWTQVTVQTKWRNQQLHDYTGQAEDKWTDGNGMLTFWMPPDSNGAGRGYVRYAVAGVQNDIRLVTKETTQVLFGADDLDTPAGRNGTQTLTRITCAKGSMITSRAFTYEKVPGATILTLFIGPDGKPLVGYVPEDGEYEVRAVFDGFPPEGSKSRDRADLPSAPVARSAGHYSRATADVR